MRLDVRSAAERRADERQRAEDKRAADAARRRKAEEQRARDEHLVVLARRQDAAWREVEELVGSHKPKSYARATVLLVDLRDVADRAGRGAAFARQLDALRARHAAKPAFLRQLRAVKI
jgi:hypothetical protein